MVDDWLDGHFIGVLTMNILGDFCGYGVLKPWKALGKMGWDGVRKVRNHGTYEFHRILSRYIGPVRMGWVGIWKIRFEIM